MSSNPMTPERTVPCEAYTPIGEQDGSWRARCRTCGEFDAADHALAAKVRAEQAQEIARLTADVQALATAISQQHGATWGIGALATLARAHRQDSEAVDDTRDAPRERESLDWDFDRARLALQERIEQAEAALASALRAQQAWQPIATAPKDRFVWLLIAGREPRLCMWDRVERLWEGQTVYYGDNDGITHWAEVSPHPPLPPAPLPEPTK